MAENELYVPSDWQQQFHALTVDEALGAGSAGPGKSLCLLMDPMQQVLTEHERCLRRADHPHPLDWGYSEGWALHLRRTRPMLEQTIVRSQRIFPIMDPGAKFDSQTTTWIFSSGYRYTFGHCRNADDHGIYLSNQYTHLALDELNQFNEEQYDQLKLRIRSSDAVMRSMLKVRSMSNPFIRREASDNFSVKDPSWVKRYFVDPAPLGGVVLKKRLQRNDGTEEFVTRIYLRATLYDNPDKEYVKQYERQLLASKPHLRDAYLHGRWDVTVGSHFGDEWEHRLHVCKPFRVPTDWSVFRSMDWGYKKPGCVHWWTLDEDENLFCIHEYTFRMKSPNDVAFAIEKYEKERGWWRNGRSALSGPADTQLWEERGDVGLSKAAEMAKCGVKWAPADKASRARNAQRVMDRLRDHNNRTTTPGLVFFESCVNAIRTIPAIPSDPNDPEVPQDGGDDHWFDCLSGDSVVSTTRGNVPLRLIRPGDMVLSADGCFWPTTGAFKVKECDELYRVAFEDGTALVGTADHRIFDGDTWKRIEHIDVSCYAYAPWIQKSSRERFRVSAASAIICAANIFNATASAFTGRFGYLSTGPSRTGTTFTIGMRIAATTPAVTSRFWKRQYTAELILEKRLRSMGRSTYERPSPLRAFGMGAWPVEHGTLKMAGELWPPKWSGLREWEPALSAAAFSKIEASQRVESSVLARAISAVAAALAWTRKPESALPAGMNSWPANSRLRRCAPGHARKVVSVERARNDETWCLTVPIMGAFVADGCLVSNSVCYATSWAQRGKKGIPKVEREKDPWEDGSHESSGDKGRLGYGVW